MWTKFGGTFFYGPRCIYVCGSYGAKPFPLGGMFRDAADQIIADPVRVQLTTSISVGDVPRSLRTAAFIDPRTAANDPLLTGEELRQNHSKALQLSINHSIRDF